MSEENPNTTTSRTSFHKIHNNLLWFLPADYCHPCTDCSSIPFCENRVKILRATRKRQQRQPSGPLKNHVFVFLSTLHLRYLNYKQRRSALNQLSSTHSPSTMDRKYYTGHRFAFFEKCSKILFVPVILIRNPYRCVSDSVITLCTFCHFLFKTFLFKFIDK